MVDTNQNIKKINFVYTKKNLQMNKKTFLKTKCITKKNIIF